MDGLKVPDPVREYVITPHALLEMERRGIDEATVRRVLGAPEQRENVRSGRDVLQSRIEARRKTHLVRVFVDVEKKPPEVVTVYRTSKLTKYWRDDR